MSCRSQSRHVSVANQVAKGYPVLAVETEHLKMLDGLVIGWARGHPHARRKHRKFYVFHTHRMAHHIVAGEIIAAPAQHILQRLSDLVAVVRNAIVRIRRRSIASPRRSIPAWRDHSSTVDLRAPWRNRR